MRAHLSPGNLGALGAPAATADSLNDPEAKRSMLKIADEYDLLAQRAGERSGKQLRRT